MAEAGHPGNRTLQKSGPARWSITQADPNPQPIRLKGGIGYELEGL
jgi:hypothetical protein